jgi:hypothetical protein
MGAPAAPQATWSAMGNACLLTPIARPTLAPLAPNASQSTIWWAECASKTIEDASITQRDSAAVPAITSLAVLANALSWGAAPMTAMTTAGLVNPHSPSTALQDIATSPSARLTPNPVARPAPQDMVCSMEFASRLTSTALPITAMACAQLAKAASS